MIAEHLTQASYLAAAVLFILSLRWLSNPKSARRGVAAGVGGMAMAIGGTLLHPEIVSFKWIAVAIVVGTVIGSAAVEGAADRSSPADGALARLRRPGGRPGRDGEVHAVAAGRPAHRVSHRRRSRSRSSSDT